MSRSTLLALAISCALTCAGSAQQPSSQPTTPPASAAGQSAPAPAAPAAPDVSKVPMNEPVLTLKGACTSTPPPQGCVSTLTREQFEALTGALQPADRGAVPPDVKRKFATQYAKLLILADEARQLGLETDPRVQQIFTFAKNQILAESLNQHYMDEYAHPTDQQIQDYYNQNQKKYLEVTLQRIIIPKMQEAADRPKPDDATQKAFADKIRERWVAGEDATKLEKESMEHSGISTTAPDVNIGARRPGSLPASHEEVFELKTGATSAVFADPAAFYIYKVVSVRQVPLDDVKSQISSTLQHQEYNDKLQQIQSAVTPVLNEAYFGPEQPQSPIPTNVIRPGGPPQPGSMPPPHGAPPSGAAAPPPPAGAAAPPQ
jgi:parvulin-like peptidyl-prolyl isomerase